MKPLKGFVLVIALQLLLGLIVRDPWWVPDLVLISVVLSAVTVWPGQWLIAAMIGGALGIVLAGRDPLVAGIGYGIVGAAASVAAVRWVLTEPRAQLVTIAVCELGLLLAWGWGDGVLTWRVFGWSLWRLAVTVLCVPWTRRMLVGRA